MPTTTFDPPHDVLECGSAWVLRSGIQESNGGVAGWYRWDLKENAPVSAGVTGYTLSGLHFVHQRTGNTDVLNAIERGARFLTGSSPGDFFDNGIAARGLLAAWRATRDGQFLENAVARGRSMANGVAPGGCYQLKAALAWLELHEETGEQRFRDAWEECLDYALAGQAWVLPGDSDHERVMDQLHAYCDFLEGLLPVLNRPRCLTVFGEGLDRASHFFRQIAPVFLRSDVCAQLLRLRIYAASARALPLEPAVAMAEASAAASFRIASADSRASGAFSFGRRQGALMPFASPLSTLFCMQALELWTQSRQEGFHADWRGLI
ncbi:MAG TPA: hypothetical protein VHD76_20095 [Bryobacteraceae bacterium]|nr:hypothetical protein [Bryobacteraceae bacterium]